MLKMHIVAIFLSTELSRTLFV